MPPRKEESVPLTTAARMLGLAPRKVGILLRANQLDEARPVAAQHGGRGRPPILITLRSIEDYARVENIVLRDVLTEAEARGRNPELSDWLTTQTALMRQLANSHIVEIDGQGETGKIWVRFFAPPSYRRKLLTYYWRQDVGKLFGARKFRIEIEDDRAHVFLRGQDDEQDRKDLARSVAAAHAVVTRELATLSTAKVKRQPKSEKKKRKSKK